MPVTIVTSRICRCGCGRRFTPNPKRPGTEYCYGHKPKVAAPSGPTPTPQRDKERDLRVYRLTTATFRRELSTLNVEIEGFDAEIDLARKMLTAAQERKDRAVDRHLVVSTAVETLEALIAGRSLASLVGAVEAT
jgi:hypothetical protein